MSMMLHEDWRKILRHAWSVRFMGLAAVLSGVEVALPAVQPYVAINPVYLSIAIGLSASAAFVSRIIAQKEFEKASHGS